MSLILQSFTFIPQRYQLQMSITNLTPYERPASDFICPNWLHSDNLKNNIRINAINHIMTSYKILHLIINKYYTSYQYQQQTTCAKSITHEKRQCIHKLVLSLSPQRQVLVPKAERNLVHLPSPCLDYLEKT